MVSLKVIFWAIIFVITNGAVFADYFKENKFLSALAGLFALISSIYLFEAIGKDVVDISGYKFLLYIVLSIIVVFIIIHILKEQDIKKLNLKKETMKERIKEEVHVWNQAIKENSKEAYKYYLQKYPNGFYAHLATIKLDSKKIIFNSFIKNIFN